MKIVKEHINEVHNFERKQNKLSSLGVGQIHLIKSWLNEMKIKNYVINDDLTIDVNGYVYLYNKNLDKFPDFIKFNKVSRNFYCDNNNLTSLEGCPTSVGGDFSCSYNNLTSLEGCPTLVDRDFYCHHNNLTSLKGCPISVGGDFYCYNNKKEFTEDEVRKLCEVKGIIEII